MHIKIKDIKIGDRHRKQLGDIQELANSIEEQGLLQPIGLTQDKELVFGARRIAAFEVLSRTEIEYRTVNVTSILDGEFAENTIRKDFTLDERIAIAKALEIEMGERRGNPCLEAYTPIVATCPPLKEKTRDIVAKIVGFGSGRTYDRAKLISEKATTEQKEKIESGESSIGVVHKEIKSDMQKTKIAERNKELSKNIVMPEGQYNVIFSDPPWKYDFSNDNTRNIENHYPTMELENIKNLVLPITENAVLYLWATSPKLIEALEVMKAWGFEYKTHAIWDKEIIGLGYWFRGQHELLLVGTKGSFSPPQPTNRVSSVFREKRKGHSQKPDYFYNLIESMFPNGKYLEVFARNTRKGWSSYGNEI